VAAVTDPVAAPPGRAGLAGRAVRVSLAPATPDPDVVALVIGPDPGGDGASAIVDDHPAVIRLDRPVTEPDRRAGATAPAVLIADGDPPARTTVHLGPARRDRRTGVRRREVVVEGWRFEVDVESEARAALRERATRAGAEAGLDGPTQVHAIIPGVVVAVAVAPGDAVAVGQRLLVVEAMKMQNELRAPRDGVVGRVTVGERQTIEVGDLLVVIE
jgi:biotin carboxyl carrier protein